MSCAKDFGEPFVGGVVQPTDFDRVHAVRLGDVDVSECARHSHCTSPSEGWWSGSAPPGSRSPTGWAGHRELYRFNGPRMVILDPPTGQVHSEQQVTEAFVLDENCGRTVPSPCTRGLSAPCPHPARLTGRTTHPPG